MHILMQVDGWEQDNPRPRRFAVEHGWFARERDAVEYAAEQNATTPHSALQDMFLVDSLCRGGYWSPDQTGLMLVDRNGQGGDKIIAYAMGGGYLEHIRDQALDEDYAFYLMAVGSHNALWLSRYADRIAAAADDPVLTAKGGRLPEPPKLITPLTRDEWVDAGPEVPLRRLYRRLQIIPVAPNERNRSRRKR